MRWSIGATSTALRTSKTAQAHGAVSATGIKAGGVGDAACFSFSHQRTSPWGEGGMMMATTTSLPHGCPGQPRYATPAWSHGDKPANVELRRPSLRLFQRLEGWLHRRRAIARCHAAFSDLDGLAFPAVREGTLHSWHQYCLWPRTSVLMPGRSGVDSRCCPATGMDMLNTLNTASVSGDGRYRKSSGCYSRVPSDDGR